MTTPGKGLLLVSNSHEIRFFQGNESNSAQDLTLLSSHLPYGNTTQMPVPDAGASAV